jgi:hypothetical protein
MEANATVDQLSAKYAKTLTTSLKTQMATSTTLKTTLVALPTVEIIILFIDMPFLIICTALMSVYSPEE